jgi:polyferredoxin
VSAKPSVTTAEALSLTQIPQAAAARQLRKASLAQALAKRHLKQGISGAIFLSFLAGGWFFPLLGYFIPVCMLMGIGIAAFRGRSWCNWLCPRCSFLDAWLQKVSPGKTIPRIFRSLPLRLGVMGLLMTVLTVQIIRLWPDPWAIGGFFIILLTVTTVAAVVLGLIFQQRTWCYLCPIGTMSSWVGKSRRPLALAADKCRECNLCSKNCPMQLAPQEIKVAGSMANRGDCLKCGLCVASCPTTALQWQGR